MFAAIFINDADSISTNNESDSTVVGERIVGWSGQVAYRLLSQLMKGSKRELVLFARYEQFDTHDKVPDGFTKNPLFDRQVVTVGASFLPIPQVAIKADSEFWKTAAGTEWEQINVGLAFMY